jgi:beta-lactamase class A
VNRLVWLVCFFAFIIFLTITRANIVQKTCGLVPTTTPPVIPLPSIVTGRVGFYAAAYQNGIVIPGSAVSFGDPTGLFPMESTYKTLVVHAAMRAVDAGKLELDQMFTTTAENRSIEAYPKGTNKLLDLAKRAIHNSDNTASDILHVAVGAESLARNIKAISSCTTILLTSKAWWAAQGGLASSVFGKDLLTGAQKYSQLPFDDRVHKWNVQLIVIFTVPCTLQNSSCGCRTPQPPKH